MQAREQVIKAALYGVLQNVAEVERVFSHHQGSGEVLMDAHFQLRRHGLVDVVLKDIKNVHPQRVSARRKGAGCRTIAHEPRHHSRLHFISKLGWIKQQQQKFQEQERETPRCWHLDREKSAYVWGGRYPTCGAVRERRRAVASS